MINSDVNISKITEVLVADDLIVSKTQQLEEALDNRHTLAGSLTNIEYQYYIHERHRKQLNVDYEPWCSWCINSEVSNGKESG